MLKTGEIVGGKDGYLWIRVPVSTDEIEVKKEVLIEFDDGYSITAAQRRKAYVLINAIALWWSDTPQEVVKEVTKLIFVSEGHTLKETFSLSDCTREEARLYITWLIDFCIINDVPCGEPLHKIAEDLERYTWACLIKKRCAVCGRKAELHHVDAVGMGRNRKEICHIGMRALPLCREHHIEIHSIGREDFLKKYILEPIRIDERIAKVYRLNTKSK